MLSETIQRRRSCRNFEKRLVDPAVLKVLLEGALLAPTSRNLKPCHFILVEDPVILERLSGSKAVGSAFLKDAPAGLVILADPERSDVWVEDCANTAAYVQLLAEELGLGSCWIQIRLRFADREAAVPSAQVVREALAIPESLEPAVIVALGYPAKNREPQERKTLMWDRVYRDRFGNREE